MQSLHLYVFQLMLNMFDLHAALTPAQYAKASQMTGCPEALQFDKDCTSAASTILWNTHNSHLCEFKRDDITPLFGLSTYAKARTTETDEGGSGSIDSGSGSNGGGNVTNSTNSLERRCLVHSCCPPPSWVFLFIFECRLRRGDGYEQTFCSLDAFTRAPPFCRPRASPKLFTIGLA